MREDRPPLTRGPVLLLTLAALLVVAAASYGAVQLVAGETTAAPPANSGSSANPEPTTAPSSPTKPPATDEADWRKAAERFGVAFTDTRGGQEAWFGRLEQLVSPSLAQGYSYTDLSLVPRERLLRVTGGSARPGETPTREATLHYSGGLGVAVTVSQAPETSRWVVTTAVPEEDQ